MKLSTIACLSLALATSPLIADADGDHPIPTQLLEKNDATYAIGHTNPDADSIIGAIAAAEFYGIKAARSGAVNPETQYILNRFKQEAPVLLQDQAGKKFVLVDFNVKSQALKCLKPENIVGIVDHHPIQDGSFLYNRVIPTDVKPWGSAVSILTNMFISNHRPISDKMAGLMMGGILSDTSGLDASKATENDHKMVKHLASILSYSKSDIDSYWKNLIAAKSDLSALSMNDILLLDYKQYVVNGYLLGIGVAETNTPQTLTSRRSEIEADMAKIAKSQGLDYMVFSVTDVRKGQEGLNLYTVSGSTSEKLAKQTFGARDADGKTWISGQTSRKRYIKPQLTETLTAMPKGNYQPKACN